jgi:CIC family chloride channel protein
LFIGCLVGQIFGMVVGYFAPSTQGQLASFMLVGVGATGASIIGAPVTMILLVLEMTGDFSATTGVLAGVLVSSAITRYKFGYSFSTWRFHLRGLRILGAHDVGWVKDITVAGIMRTGMKTVPADMHLAQLRQLHPPGSAKRLFVVDAAGHYKGVIDVAALHDAALDAHASGITALSLAKGGRFLLPSQDIQSALKAFSKGETEELPVVASADEPELIGYVTEAYALRRYNQELEARSLMLYGTGGPVHETAGEKP